MSVSMAPGVPAESGRETAKRGGTNVPDVDADSARGRLDDERQRLESLREAFEADGVGRESEEASISELSHMDQHQADIGTETFNRERDLSILEQVEAELRDVERAMKRLDDGTYGSCEACGKPIADERLAAMPAARFCVDDQAKAEHESHPPG